MNTYFDLCAVLCLGIFALALFTSSLIANVAAGLLRRFRLGNRGSSPARLFLLRTLPITLSLFLILGLALPAFLLLEPRQTRETPEPYLILLAGLSVVASSVSVARALRALYVSQRVFHNWLEGAQRIHTRSSIPVFRIEAPSSLFAVTGIFKPKVFIGREALACLSRKELDAAIAHELAHVHFFDNLKRFVLSVTRLPGYLSHLESLDSAWFEAAELAADKQALQGGASALDLGSAIIKIGRLRPYAMPSAPACHLVSSSQSSAIAVRLERLRFFLDNPDSIRPQSFGRAVGFLLILLLGYLLLLPPALEVTHHAMEWLVK